MPRPGPEMPLIFNAFFGTEGVRKMILLLAESFAKMLRI
jgi:hypothetical protein